MEDSNKLNSFLHKAQALHGKIYAESTHRDLKQSWLFQLNFMDLIKNRVEMQIRGILRLNNEFEPKLNFIQIHTFFMLLSRGK